MWWIASSSPSTYSYQLLSPYCTVPKIMFETLSTNFPSQTIICWLVRRRRSCRTISTRTILHIRSDAYKNKKNNTDPTNTDSTGINDGLRRSPNPSDLAESSVQMLIERKHSDKHYGTDECSTHTICGLADH